jgi:GMP synthase (glutamine-hydrolysing)
MPTVCFLQHDDHDTPALIGEYLRDARFELDVRRLDLGDPLPAAGELGGLAALVALGGDLNVDDDTTHPFLADERELLAQAIAREVPTLGVCLGAQQLALAGGGEVYRRESLFLGWNPIEFAARDALVRGLHPRPLVFSWRDYACRLPDAALLLAEGDAGGRTEPQIFRFGEVAWGLMFHPEVDKPLLADWFERDAAVVERAYPGGVKPLLEASKRELLRSAMLCGQLMGNFLAAGRLRER